ncbi:MFS transporter [Propionimicrobium sp. PCR01-08-3]|uniref:MFS transporter n=1 Tax=Propionimicrobium sp. PCR01-08-3 TaxID=3052086 RepID=UPI00255CD1E1|nr:MFS transporter [Propionimicrobium sp. PCR01-08-3]WIY83052.1 MFS transporter [Propionimicrobium sp. PCR01-08-3]
MSDAAPGPQSRAQWARVLIAIYGPTLLASIGFGAIIPLIPLQATALGASPGVAAFITAIPGIGMLIFDLPAGTIAARLGERLSIVLACLLDAAIMVCVYLAGSITVLGLAVFIHGMTGSIFQLARQTYVTDAIPLKYRARGMSSLGGVFRIGSFIGPLAVSALISGGEIRNAFVFASCTSLVAAAVTMLLPKLSADRAQQVNAAGERPHTFKVLADHRHSLLTVGMGCMALMMLRTARQTIIPLWGEANGLPPHTVSLLYAVSMGFEVLLFFPGGMIMDRFGRWWVCVPTTFLLGIGLALLPVTHSAGSIAILAAILGMGNGISSGIVLTLGADAAPRFGRSQFLAGWRVLSDSGQFLGPMVISAATALSGLGAASVVIGALGVLGGGWLAKWVPRTPDQIADFRPKD